MAVIATIFTHFSVIRLIIRFLLMKTASVEQSLSQYIIYDDHIIYLLIVWQCNYSGAKTIRSAIMFFLSIREPIYDRAQNSISVCPKHIIFATYRRDCISKFVQFIVYPLLMVFF